MSKKVKCNDCMHERGIGFDAWCNLGLKHHLNDLHTCEAFTKQEFLAFLNSHIGDKNDILL